MSQDESKTSPDSPFMEWDADPDLAGDMMALEARLEKEVPGIDSPLRGFIDQVEHPLVFSGK